jgi:1,4-alpha-glucan branching enzyme
MGAVPFEGGVLFRVWAPHADAVFVTGSFNDWAEDAHPLSREDGGLWAAEVSEARPGDEYKFALRNGDQTLLRNDPRARQVTHSSGNSVIYDPASFDWGEDSSFQRPPWNELVVYEMHVGTFNDLPGGGPGTFQDAIAKLPYLGGLGVNAVELMPVSEFPGGFSWGYNPSHPFAVETDYGGPDGLKAFVKAAHAQGLAVFLDVVYNHFGPSDLDLWRFDGWFENDLGGIYFYNNWRAHTPWGATRPDYGRAEVRQYIRDNAALWLDEFHIDGLRWDATAYIRNADGTTDAGKDIAEGWGLMRWVNDDIHAAHPGKISIAEDLRANEWVTRETAHGGAGFDAQWHAGFVHPIRKAIIHPEDSARDLDAVVQALTRRFNVDVFERVVFTESHDEVASGKARVPEEISPDDPDSVYAKKRSALGAALVFTTPGIPMIFQGQEFLEDEWFRDQVPVDWSGAKRYAGIVQMYQDLVRLRRNAEDRTRGLIGQGLQVHHVNPEDKVIAFHRWKEGGPRDSVVVVVNLANQSHDNYRIGFPRDGRWTLRFNSDAQAYDAEFGDYPSSEVLTDGEGQDGLPAAGNFGIGPYAALVFSQDD